MSRIVFTTKIAGVENKRRLLRGWKDKDGNDQFEYENLGWFIHIAGSYEWLFISHDKPDFEVGDAVRVSIEKVTDETPNRSASD